MREHIQTPRITVKCSTLNIYIHPFPTTEPVQVVFLVYVHHVHIFLLRTNTYVCDIENVDYREKQITSFYFNNISIQKKDSKTILS